MKRFIVPLRWLWLCAALALAGCFHDDNDNTNNNSTVATTVSGTAATGAAMTGTVTAVGANGAQANTVIGTGGAYTLNVNGLTFPLFIRANDGTGTVLYSWADASGDVANITPLTTLALILSDLPDNLSEVFANWATSSAQLTATTMQAAQAKVNANLQTQFAAKGVDHTKYDFLTTAFTANGSGIDGVLDALDFSFNYLGSNLAGVVSITLAGTTTPITINIGIDTSGIVGGTGGGSTGGTGGSTGGMGGGSASLSCDTSLFQPGTSLHVPSTAEWATYAKIYVVDEGTFNSNPPPAPPFLKTGSGTLVLESTYGTVTYNGTSYPLTTACVVVTDSMLYLGFGTGSHIDIFDNGTVSGFSPADVMVGIKTP